MQSGISSAYSCVGHSESWCSGYNDGFRAGNGGSNIFYAQSSDQTADIKIHGDSDKISITEQSDYQAEFTSRVPVLLFERILDIDVYVPICFMSSGVNRDTLREIHPSISLVCFIKNRLRLIIWLAGLFKS